MSQAWYVVQVATNMEDRVQNAITLNISKKIVAYVADNNVQKSNELKHAFGISSDMNDELQIEEHLKKNNILVPKEKVEEIKNGKKREMERKSLQK